MANFFNQIFKRRIPSKEERLAKINANEKIRVAEAPYRPKIIIAYTFRLTVVILTILLLMGVINFAQFISAITTTGIGNWLAKIFS